MTLFEFLLRMGDTTLILGQRLSEWCGHAPALEEDIALANTALDLIGQTQMWLSLAGEIEGQGRSADDLAMLRDVWDFRSHLLVELPNGDFGFTILRQCVFDQWHLLYLQGLGQSAEPRIAAIAQKAVKEVTYHAERSSDLVIRLGDGSEESHRRMQAALDRLAPYIGELITPDALDREMSAARIAPDLETVGRAYGARLTEILDAATLIRAQAHTHLGGKSGQRHTEHLGHLLSTMQWLQRAYPGAVW